MMESKIILRTFLVVGAAALLLAASLMGLTSGRALGKPLHDAGSRAAAAEGACDTVCVDESCIPIPVERLEPIVITDTFIIYPTSACLCENADGSKRLEGEGEVFLPNIQTDEADGISVTFTLDWPSLDPQCVYFTGTWEEGIPIDDSGFLLTSLEGDVTLDPEPAVVVSGTLESELQNPDGSGPAVTGEGTVSVDLEEPYTVTFEGVLTVLALRSVQAIMTLDQSWGFAGTTTLEGPVCDGPASLHVWEEGEDVYGFSGSASLTCIIEEDSLTPEGWPDSLPGLPAKNITVTAESELGEFCLDCQGGECIEKTYGVWAGADLDTFAPLSTDLNLPEWAVEPGTVTARFFVSSTGILSATTNLVRCQQTTRGAYTQSLYCLNQAPTITITSPTTVEEEPDGGIYTISWAAGDPDDDAVVSLYYDRDSTGRDGKLIACCLNEGDGTYAWDTSEVGSGAYYIYGRIDDGRNLAVVDYSDGTVKVVDTTPPAAPEGLSVSIEGAAPGLGLQSSAGEDALFGADPMGSRAVVLQWQANAEEDVAGYRVHYGPEPGLYTDGVSIRAAAYTSSYDVTNVTRFRLPHKPAPQTAYVAVSAYDNSGNESPPSEAVRVLWPQIYLASSITGLDRPVHITHAGDSSGRLFVVEKAGRIRIVEDGVLSSTPFLDITSRVGSLGSEQGLLSVAFPPDYASKGYFYVNYTDTSGDTVVARYHVTADPDVADPNSEEVLLTVDQPYGNHNGGQLAFGPSDGYLYIGMGDGGAGGDPENRAQNPGSLLGKLLRIDVESGTSPYAVPATNPYTQTNDYRGEIWALGLRNPWRFSFDRQTRDLYIADVGQNIYEEVNYQPASSSGGENYGWNIMEGLHCYNSPGCDDSGLTPPVVEYDHSQGCSITGGMVYRGLLDHRMQGVYFYADYCSGRIWGLARDGAWQSVLLYDASFSIASFGEDEAGNLYVTDYDDGVIYAITETPPCPDFAGRPGEVDADDIQAVAGHWRRRSTDADWDARFDRNRDGSIDIVDIAQVAAVWGNTCQ